MTGRPRSLPNPGEEPKVDKRGLNHVEIERRARYCVETFTTPSEFKTRREWVEALDETLTDLARACRLEPKVSLIDVWGEMTA